MYPYFCDWLWQKGFWSKILGLFILEASLSWNQKLYSYLKVKPIRKVMGQAIFEPFRFKSGNFNNGIACLVETLSWLSHKSADPISPVLSVVWSCYHISKSRLRWCDRSDSVIEMELDNHPRAIAIIGLWLLDYWLAEGAVLEQAKNWCI